MKRILPSGVIAFILLTFLFSSRAIAQCSFTFSTIVAESRCMATGSITVNVSGGSGNFNYKLSGGPSPINTSTNVISGLAPGTYTVEVKDLNGGCTLSQSNVVVGGNYQDPRFVLSGTDVTCINGTNGTITAINQQYGRAPFSYSIVAPSPSGVGSSNPAGTFTNLIPGDYYIRLTDSCGGIQTRIYTIANYNWWISAKTVARVACDSADISVTLQDNKGNTNLSGSSFNGFMYGVTKVPGDTTWFNTRSFRIYLGNTRALNVVVKSVCGTVQSSSWTDTNKPSVSASVSISNYACSTFSASITGQSNLNSPQYCLYNNLNVLVSCNTTGVFSNVPYGSYCIQIRDNCYDTTISRCFTASQPLPNVNASVSTSNLTCSDFTATVTGQQNLYSPLYCIYDNNNILLSCNATGVFNNLPYGSYCIQITDGCTGTVISRCFTRLKQIPSVGSSVSISNRACTTFTATITGQTNLNNPQYCIYDNIGNLVTCNTTGVFNNLPYGSYCVNVTNNVACYDTTIQRCFTVNRPVPSASSSVSISNKACSTFTATITGQTNLTNPQFCIYDNLGNQISCNTTGVFTGLAYGSYCINVVNDPACYDTTITRCFTVSMNIPSVSASVSISNRGCTTFTASITGQSNLNTPQYCLYDNANNQVSCNTTGVFNNISYGSYCIRVVNSCYDTTITRCFSVAANTLNPSLSGTASCTIGSTNLTGSWTATGGPYSINIYNPVGALVNSGSTSGTSYSVTLPGLPSGMSYKMIVSDACGSVDSASVIPVASSLIKSINANSKCPGGQWLNGSGDLIVSASYSQGSVTPKIIKKDGASISINYSSVSGSNYTFSNLAPAVYVIEYSLQSCFNKVYDTFNLAQYSFPSLAQSAVYQCNNNIFSVSAAVSGGLAPFSYEIMGSTPSSPSITTGGQASPVFNINNGTKYDLVRLRAVDACGNATINDASVLPLANTTVNATSNCFFNDITLSVDTIANATYTWYKKTSATDSTLLASSQNYNISYLLPSDTGTYVCVVSVNSGCLTRTSYFDLNGLCGGSLATGELDFNGKLDRGNSVLSWSTGPQFGAELFVVEKSTDGRNFNAIGFVKASSGNGQANRRYIFTDQGIAVGKNYYRLQIKKGEKYSYSQIISLYQDAMGGIRVIPNPVYTEFRVNFNVSEGGNYLLRLMGADGRDYWHTSYQITAGESRTISRPASIGPGVYYLVITHPASGERQVIQLMFQ